MDSIVRQAMIKWPQVPACYGWLGLDARGDWYLRDAQAQAAGAFQSGMRGSKGARLEHEKLLDFIGRNYEVQDNGCWYFQNGPQRVYVELEYTPWVWRIHGDFDIRTHTGLSAGEVFHCLVDENGRVYLHAELGVGLVHTQDVVQLEPLLARSQWPVQEISRAEIPRRFGFELSPENSEATPPNARARQASD